MIDKIMTEETELKSINGDIMAINIALYEWIKSGGLGKWIKDLRGGKSWIEWKMEHSKDGCW